ncbi:MAG: (2Fe-2S)-binding protein [Gammaproteobacteria bacterium]
MKQYARTNVKGRLCEEAGPAVARRGFVKICTAAAAAVAAHPALLASPDAVLEMHERVRLVSGAGGPLKSADLQPGHSYIFNYPFATTPCFLLNLEQPANYGLTLATRDGTPYVWQGGVGPRASIVGFVAICAHKMSHPSKTVSFLNFQPGKIGFRDRDKQAATGTNLIHCCSERSVYDPSQGARVLGGPAREPLAAVLLEHHQASDTLHALGVYGGQLYQAFFDRFGLRLAIEHGISDVRKPISHEAVVVSAEDYSRTRMACG